MTNGKPVELSRRGGAHTFEDLEAEALGRGQQAANASTLSGADLTAPKEDAPKADPKVEPGKK